MDFLVAGLGNPGPRYHRTRHNVGFMLIDRIAARLGCACASRSGQSLVGEILWSGHSVVLAKPQTFMNASGRAVRELADRHRLRIDQILIVYDEIALPLGRMRIRASGSAGGHNGMKSVIRALDSSEIPRLRIGVLGARKPSDLTDYVLSNFSQAELKALEEILDRADSAVEVFISQGIETAMAQYNSTGPADTSSPQKKEY